MSKVLIAGCGYVGSALGAILAHDGHEVWGLRRSQDTLPETIQAIDADLRAPDLASILPPAIDIAFYTAGAAEFTEAAYRATYVDALKNLLRALHAQDTPPKRFFFTSSTGVYAQDQGGWVDEDSPTAPTRFSGRILLEAEAILADAAIAATVVRFGGIYGPGRSRLLDAVRAGAAQRTDRADQYLNLIHRDDCAGALRHLMRLPGPDSLYLAVDNEPVERNTLLCWCAERLGKEKPPIAPAAAAREPPRGGNRRCRNARLLATGYLFQYPSYREGYNALL